MVMQYNFDFSKLLKGASRGTVGAPPLVLPVGAKEGSMDNLEQRLRRRGPGRLLGIVAGVCDPPAWLFSSGPMCFK